MTEGMSEHELVAIETVAWLLNSNIDQMTPDQRLAVSRAFASLAERPYATYIDLLGETHGERSGG